jgi:hypothetical protein
MKLQLARRVTVLKNNVPESISGLEKEVTGSWKLLVSLNKYYGTCHYNNNNNNNNNSIIIQVFT